MTDPQRRRAAPARSHDDRPPVVTGLGAVSPIGVGLAGFLGALRSGRSGVRAVDLPEREQGWIASTAAATCARIGDVGGLDPADIKRLPRLVPMGLAAAREALGHARLDPGADEGVSRRVGVILGTGAGGIDFTLDQAQHAYPEPATDARGLACGISLWTITNATHGNLAGELSIRLGARGPSLCISTGCASSSDAAGHAMDLLRSPRPGAPDAVVVVGADAHVRWETLRSMELLRVISTRHHDTASAPTASRPFDATRDGFVLGEGAWAMVLERRAHAEERGARPIAEMLGYGSTCDAYHRVRPEPGMGESVRAMRLAMDDAGVEPKDIDVLHYHGTATKLNDRQETEAVRAAFGDHAERLAGCSIKGAIGHPQGACGAASCVAAIGSLANADDHADGPFVPPTINLREPDPACDLDYTPLSARPTDARTALVNCLAFGAKNSALVLRATR